MRVNHLLEQVYRLKIWVRLVIFIWLAIALAWGGVLVWAFRVQRDAAVAQATDFAASVHQVTLAGLTAMLVSGQAADRAVFLDQIRQSNNIRALRVVRGDAVTREYGPGTPDEAPGDAMEREALRSGTPVHEVRSVDGRQVMKAVLPALASSNYLGKNCLACHQVPEGAVLGAVSLEISLAKVDAATAAFVEQVSWTAAFISIPLILLIYLSVSRSVTRPLRAMTDGLNRIAAGRVDLDSKLRVRGHDEIAEAAAAFNTVMDRAHQMVREERVAADVFEHALEGILVTDRDGRIMKVNPAFTRTTGYDAHEAIGHTPAILRSGRHDESFYREFWETLKTRGEWRGDIWNKRKNGEIYPQWLNISSVRNERGEIEHYVALFSDITDRKREEALMHHRAHHDALTGLPNRALFREQLEQALATARGNPDQAGAVMFLDLDRFKLINDSLGHDIGDLLLKEVARRLRASVRAGDLVARLGGDEFTVLLHGIGGPEGAEVVAEKILASTRLPYVLGEHSLLVTTSIGICLFPVDGDDPDTVMRHADRAMYHIKEQGRSGYCFYASTLSARAAVEAVQRAIR